MHVCNIENAYTSLTWSQLSKVVNRPERDLHHHLLTATTTDASLFLQQFNAKNSWQPASINWGYRLHMDNPEARWSSPRLETKVVSNKKTRQPKSLDSFKTVRWPITLQWLVQVRPDTNLTKKAISSCSFNWVPHPYPSPIALLSFMLPRPS